MDHTKVKWFLPVMLAVMGFLFSSRTYILWLDKQNPFVNLVLYYTILIVTLYILQKAGLIISGIEFNSMRHLIGSILIIFSYFLIIDWESCYINIVTKGSCESISNIYLGSEDGAVYYLWNKIIKNVETLRIMTYVVTPLVLSFIGANLITEKVYISPI